MFTGRTELLVLLAVAAMICLTVLVALDKVAVGELVAAAPGLIGAAAAFTAAKRADAAHDRLDDTPEAPPRAGFPVAPPPSSTRLPALLLALMLPVALASGGCTWQKTTHDSMLRLQQDLPKIQADSTARRITVDEAQAGVTQADFDEAWRRAWAATREHVNTAEQATR